MNERRSTRRAAVVARAEKDFGAHVLTVEGEGRWHFGRPATGMYGFRVITAPGLLMLYGDIGELVLRMSDLPIPWLRGTVAGKGPDVDYLLGKAAWKEREFLPAEADQVLREMKEQGGHDLTLAQTIERNWHRSGTPEEAGSAWREAYYDATGDAEIPGCDDWSWQMLFQAAALGHFARALDALATVAAGAVSG